MCRCLQEVGINSYRGGDPSPVKTGEQMKSFLLITLSAVLAFSAPAQEFDSSRFDGVLKVRVEDGLVDYRGLKADPLLLTHYLLLAGRVSEVEFNSWTEPQQLAFLINLYNASTLHLVLDHYPVDSIKEIGSLFKGPWDQSVVPLFGKTITLNELEHGIIRKQHKEPRIHMALVCAAKTGRPSAQPWKTGDIALALCAASGSRSWAVETVRWESRPCWIVRFSRPLRRY